MKPEKAFDQKAQEWAERMRSGKNFAHTYLEKPAMYGKIPRAKGKAVLCMGCGSGEECAHLWSLGAKRVVGIDRSEGLIAIAKKTYPQIEFLVMDMRKMNFPGSSFDFAYSSLAMHYLRDWRPTLRNLHKVLKPDGLFLFSTHHPAYWSAEIIQNKSEKTRLLGYTKKHGRPMKVYGDYQSTHKIDDRWFGNMEVSYYHRPLAEILLEIGESGFVITDFIEPRPQKLLKKISRDDFEVMNKIPLFMILETRKQ